MQKIEKAFGSVLAGILLLIIGWSILISLFSLFFRDGRNTGLYGGRGEFYMSE